MLALSFPADLFFDLGVVLVAGVAASVLMAALRLPAVAGLLLAGALCGPYGFAAVQDTSTIKVMAEVGVVLLLFTIGLEFPLSRFLRFGKTLIIGGGLQVSLTAACALGVGMIFGLPFGTAMAIGFAASLSSTAIVLKGLSERGETDAPHGRLIVGILLFQDLCVIPMMLALPLLAGAGSITDTLANVGTSLGLAAVSVVVTIGVSRVVLPWILKHVDRTRSREIFVLAILGICLGFALITEKTGLSAALGAFMAGVVLADSPVATRAEASVAPMHDLMTSIFFISLGMMFDVTQLIENPILILGIAALILFGKALLAIIAALVMRFPLRAAVLGGVTVAQFGEFGFVLLEVAGASPLSLVDMQAEGQILLTSAMITMFLTPVVTKLAPRIAAGATLLRPLEKLLGARGMDNPATRHMGIRNHVIVAGYGVGGRLLVSALKAVGVPYLVLEMNLETVRRARANREPIYYADITGREALEHAGIHHAKAVVITVNDPDGVRRSLDVMSRIAPETPVLVRTRYLGERDELLEQGAADVVSAEVEASLEILARLLRRMDVPRNLIDRETAQARQSVSDESRPRDMKTRRMASDGILGHLATESFQVTDSAYAKDKTLRELDLRRKVGVTAIAVVRGTDVISNPDADDPLLLDDILYLCGQSVQVRDALTFLDKGALPETEPSAS